MTDTALDAVIERLADLDRPVLVVSGDASAGVAQQFAGQLGQLRSGVALVQGSAVSVGRQLALAAPNSTAIVVDLRRYEQWVLDAHGTLVDRGIWCAGVTDSVLSPIAQRADATFLVSAAAVGPFDSHLGTHAVLNLVTTRVAAELRSSAADRLTAIEGAWGDSGALSDGA